MFKFINSLCICIIVLTCLGSNDAKIRNDKYHPTTKSSNLKVDEDRHVLTVIKVADGDTITIRNETDRSTTRVRFLCIDAPEKSQEKWGKISTDRLKELLPLYSKVTLIGSKLDMYNRTLAEVVNSNGTNTNLQMMEEGMVVFYPYQKGCKEFRDMEAKAQKGKKGVWQDKNFEKPWDYRKKSGIGYRGGAFDNKSKNGTHYETTRKYYPTHKWMATNSTRVAVGKTFHTKSSYKDAFPEIGETTTSTTRRYSERLATKTTTVFSYKNMLLKDMNFAKIN